MGDEQPATPHAVLDLGHVGDEARVVAHEGVVAVPLPLHQRVAQEQVAAHDGIDAREGRAVDLLVFPDSWGPHHVGAGAQEGVVHETPSQSDPHPVAVEGPEVQGQRVARLPLAHRSQPIHIMECA